MTEEENEAIETLQYLCSDDCINKDIIKTIVKLIEKLQKEIEELKNKVVKRDKELIKLEEYANKNFERKDDVKARYIPKGKIKEEIKVLNKDLKKCSNTDVITRHIIANEIEFLEKLVEEE